VIAWISINLPGRSLAIRGQAGEIMVNVILVYHLKTLEISVEVNKEI
jgi:hypothetical protein